jgi:hypothetical protein
MNRSKKALFWGPYMDLAKVLANLHEELDSLNMAIATLERLQQGGRRRGRPPKPVQEQTNRATELTGKQPAKTERRHP